MGKNDLASIRDTATRCKQEGLPLTECSLRRLAKQGDISACYIGKKALLYWPNIVSFIQNGNNRTAKDTPMQSGVIRRQG